MASVFFFFLLLQTYTLSSYVCHDSYVICPNLGTLNYFRYSRGTRILLKGWQSKMLQDIMRLRTCSCFPYCNILQVYSEQRR